MTLGFSEKFKHNGKPTNFLERIWAGLTNGEAFPDAAKYQPDHSKQWKPKIHSMRDDPQDRWKEGMVINMVYFNRSRNRYEFARAVCTGTQVVHVLAEQQLVYVGGKELREEDLIEFVQNDGFVSVIDFFEFFTQDSVKRLIHWTSKRY